MKIKTNMSPEAITERLRLTSELRRLCLELGKAKPVEPNKEGPKRQEEKKIDSGHS